MAPDRPGLPALVIDPEACVGSQDCILAEPGLFALGEEGIAYVADPAAVAKLPVRRLHEIAGICPNAAIAVRAAKD